MDRRFAPTDVVALSVHGPLGVLDLHVPAAALTLDVATEYARQAGLLVVPTLRTPMGAVLAPGVTLAEADVASGSVLVAVVPAPGAAASPAPTSAPTPAPGPAPPRDPGPGASGDSGAASGARRLVPGSLSALWFTVAAGAAVVAGGVAARLPDGSGARTATLVLLVGAAVVGVLPVGAPAPHRVLAAPAFAGAAAFAVAWSPEPARLPTVVGVAALAAAVAAAVARALDRHAEEGLRTWILAGVACFAVAALGALVGADAQVVWGILLALGLLAARFVPTVAVDVPDLYLLDLDRLAGSAGSAGDRATAHRARVVVPVGAVEAVAAHGRRLVDAACVAVLVVSVTAGGLLLRSASYDVDRVGARAMVGLAGLCLVLTARSYRHATARAVLRATGVLLIVEIAAALLGAGARSGVPSVLVITLGLVVALAAAGLVVAGVALGRGRRSAWWGRRAELAEAICGAAALASLVVVLGIFRRLWELTG